VPLHSRITGVAATESVPHEPLAPASERDIVDVADSVEHDVAQLTVRQSLDTTYEDGDHGTLGFRVEAEPTGWTSELDCSECSEESPPLLNCSIDRTERLGHHATGQVTLIDELVRPATEALVAPLDDLAVFRRVVQYRLVRGTDEPQPGLTLFRKDALVDRLT